MIKEKYLYEYIIKDIKIGELFKEDKKRVYVVGQKYGVFVFLDKGRYTQYNGSQFILAFNYVKVKFVICLFYILLLVFYIFQIVELVLF